MSGPRVFMGRPISGGDSLVTIETEHAHVHKGKAFRVDLYSVGVAQNGTILVQIKAPETADIHLKEFDFGTNQDSVQLELIENPTSVTDGTTPIVPRNSNRCRPDALSALTGKMFSDPSSIVGGETIQDLRYDTAAPFFASGGFSHSDSWEWILHRNYGYIVRVTNLDTTAAFLYLRLKWYEES